MTYKYPKHWVKMRRSRRIRRDIYRGLVRTGMRDTTARRMRDWTFPHIFKTIFYRGLELRELASDMEMCERVRRMMNGGDSHERQKEGPEEGASLRA